MLWTDYLNHLSIDSLQTKRFWKILGVSKRKSISCQAQRETQQSIISTQSFYKSRQIAGNTRHHRSWSSHTFISQIHLFTVIQPYPPSTLSHLYTSHALHTEISSHDLSTCLTDLFMQVIRSQSPRITVQPCRQPAPTDTSIHVLYRLTQRATPPTQRQSHPAHCNN